MIRRKEIIQALTYVTKRYIRKLLLKILRKQASIAFVAAFLILLLLIFTLDAVTKSSVGTASQRHQEVESVSVSATQHDFLSDKIREDVIVERVIDGDTFDLVDGRRVRLIGVDAPERGDRYFAEATEALEALLKEKTIQIEKDESDTDKYTRLLRYVYIDGVFINKKLVGEGWARARAYYPDTRYHKTLEEAEQRAQELRIGMWRQVLQN